MISKTPITKINRNANLQLKASARTANWFAFFLNKKSKLANQIQIKSAKLAKQIQIWTKWFVSNIRVRKYLSLVICATALVVSGQISLTTVCKSFLLPSMVKCLSVLNPIHPFLKMSWVKQCINKLDKRQAFLHDTSLRASVKLWDLVINTTAVVMVLITWCHKSTQQSLSH